MALGALIQLHHIGFHVTNRGDSDRCFGLAEY